MNSVVNLMVTDIRNSLGPEQLNKLVVFHINKTFISHCRTKDSANLVKFHGTEEESDSDDD